MRRASWKPLGIGMAAEEVIGPVPSPSDAAAEASERNFRLEVAARSLSVVTGWWRGTVYENNSARIGY
jgi:hypothetical protein